MEDRDFMVQALALARQALEAGEFPVGCVVALEGRVVATGSRSGTADGGRNETDHAEMTALRRFQRLDDLDAARAKATVYCTLEPCLMCFGAILISGIHRIVYAYEDVMGGGTGCNLKTLNPLYREAEMNVVAGVLRSESLQLLKAYFSNPKTDYWRGSLLARHTLSL